MPKATKYSILKLFPLFFILLLFIPSGNASASSIDFTKKVILLDNQGELVCKDNNCLINGETFILINNEGVIKVSYYHKDNISNSYYSKDSIVYEKLVNIPVINNYVLIIRDFEDKIIYEYIIYENNFDNFITYGAGRFLNNSSIMAIPSIGFALALTVTKMLYYDKKVV